MPKRKRTEPEQSHSKHKNSHEVLSSRTVPQKRKLVAARLNAGTKALIPALRHAATLERQKHSRRRKTALEKKDDKAVERLDKEYAVLKALDLNKVAESQLRRTVGRVKSLKDAEELPKGWGADADKGTEKEDVVTLNVKARLFKVQVVRTVVDEVVDDLKIIIGSGLGGDQKETNNTRGKKARVEENDQQQEVDSRRRKTTQAEADAVADEDFSDEGLEGAFAAFDARIAAPSSAEEDNDDSLSEGDRLPSDYESEERDYELNEEDESDIDSESGSDVAIPHGAIAPASDDEDEDNDSFEEFESESELGTTARSKSKSKLKDEEPLKRPSASTFLPSLSHAAYFSGSESEASDIEEQLAPKKNRRGQRARQKIWEQKFGEKAKHVQKEDRNKGWDPKRGAVDDKGRRGDRKATNPGRGPEISGENAIPLGPKKAVKKRDDIGTLHPSWAAAKAAKEKKMDAKPTGKKITFD